MALPATDNFNRSDGGLGSNWSGAPGSDLAISSNQVTGSAAYTDCSMYWNADSPNNDQYAQIDLATRADYDGVGARMSGTDGIFLSNATANAYDITWYNGGSWTLLGSWATTPTSGDVLKLEVEGTAVRGFINGTQRISGSNASIPSSGYGGAYCNGTSGRVDNFEVGNLASESSSASPSVSPSSSISSSESPSLSPSSSVSPSLSPSASVSPSLSPSSSVSPSLSPSASVSPSEEIISGSTVWGHITGVIESNVRTFASHWSGTGDIQNSGDSERLALQTGEYMDSELVYTGATTVTLLYNQYLSGDGITLKYRTGSTEVACLAAAWVDYTVPFASDNYVQIRIEE